MSTMPGRERKGQGASPSSAQPRRSRIVVNLDDDDDDAGVDESGTSSSASARRGRVRSPRLARQRRRRVLSAGALLCVGLLLLLALGGYWWWQRFQRQPSYSLALLVDAAERDDAATFAGLIDVDAVSRSLVPQVVEKVAAGAGSGGGGLVLPPAVRRQVAANAAVLLPGARDAIRSVLMTEMKAGAQRGGASSYPFFVKAIGVSQAVDKVTPGIEGADAATAATIALKLNQRPTELMMRCVDASCTQGWRIVGVKSDELASRVADNLARGLPSFGR